MNTSFKTMMLFLLGLSLVVTPPPTQVAADEGLRVRAYRHWPAESYKSGIWGVELNFNHPVFVSNLAESLKAVQAGGSLVVEFRDTSSKRAEGAVKTCIVIGATPVVSNQPVNITVDKGLSDATGRRVLDKAFSYTLIPIDEIEVSNLSTFFTSKAEKGLYISISSRVAPSELKKAIKFKPEVPGVSVSQAGWHRYRITGDFEFGRDYVLEVVPDKVDDGKAVLVARSYGFTGPGIKPELTFNTERSVMELRSRQLLPVTMSNVTKLRCNLSKIPACMVPEVAAALNSGKKAVALPSQDRRKQVEDMLQQYKASWLFRADSAEDAEAFIAPEAENHVYAYSLPLSFRKSPETGGAWIARLTDPDGNFKGSAVRLIQITDMSVSYKLAAKTLLVWVTSMHTGEPVAGAQVVLAQSDGLSFLVGATDKNGLLAVNDGSEHPSLRPNEESGRVSRKPIGIASMKWVVAATATDSAAIQLEGDRLKSVMAVPQAQTGDPRALSGNVFTERGIYQPGDTAHFKFTARSYKDGMIKPPEGEQVTLTITDSRNEVRYSEKHTLGAFGSTSGTFPIKGFFPVGNYTIRADYGDDRGKGDQPSRTFLVGEYKVPRHFVNVSLKTEEKTSTEYVTLQRKEQYLVADIKGRYYAGGPLKHGKVTWKATLVPAEYKVKGFD
ncbi:MAG: MG2 domain-containing protein, partial [Pseudomonadota bacterium]